MPFICTDEIRRCVMGFNPVSDRIAIIRLQCKPVNMTALQVYAPTSTAEEEEMEEFYEKVQHVVDEIPRGDVLYVIGDWNAKVGQDETNGTTGRFGVGERNERGDQLVEFCSRNDLQIMNTFFKLHARRLYTWRSPDQTTRKWQLPNDLPLGKPAFFPTMNLRPIDFFMRTFPLALLTLLCTETNRYLPRLVSSANHE